MKPYLLASFLLGCSSLAAGGVFGLPDARHPDHNQGAAPSGLMPPGRSFETPDHQGRGQLSAKDAAQEAQQINGGGRVLSVDAANGGWRVKLLKDGNVRIVFVAQ